MATPNAAGVAALIVSRFGDFSAFGRGRCQPDLSSARSSSRRSAVVPEPAPVVLRGPLDFPFDQATCQGSQGNNNGFFGSGIVDAMAALGCPPLASTRPRRGRSPQRAAARRRDSSSARAGPRTRSRSRAPRPARAASGTRRGAPSGRSRVCCGLGCRYWPIVTTSTPCARRSRSVCTTSSFVSPRPTMMPGLREHVVVGDLLRALEQPERAVVVGLAAAHLTVQAAHGLDVVVEDLGARADHRRERLLLDPEEVRRQDLDRRRRELRLDRADRRRVMGGAAVGDVVAVDRRHDDVLQLHLRGGLRDAQRLERVGRRVRPARVDVAVPARAGAGVAEDLEGRGAAAPALGDVRAPGLLADRVQREAVEQLLDVEEAPVLRRRAHLHPFGAARALGDGKRRLHLVPVYVCGGALRPATPKRTDPSA